MSKADIMQAGSSMQKNLDNKNYETALDILKQLRKEVAATDAILKETKIGLVVGKLRKHENKAVAEISSEIVKKWKQEIDAAKTKNGAPKPAVTAEKSSGGASNGSPADSSKSATPRTAESDGVKTTHFDDPVRNNCIKLIYNGLAVDAEASVKSGLILDKACSIEASVYKKFAGKIDGPYKQKMRSLYLNLKGTNISLRRDVVSGSLEPEAFCLMTAEEMASDERKAENKRLEEESIFAAMAAVNTKASTDMFKCSKCGKNETTYYQMQTRSADEPMTTFVVRKTSNLARTRD